MRWPWTIVGVLMVLLIGGGIDAVRVADQAGAATMAKVACSCVFVDGRALACRADDPPGFGGVAVSIDPAAKTATGSVFGLITRRATYSEAYGCTLEP
jgi:imidazole glycerol phosphate synthase subunit HisF